jgi:broad specificity phosphatase PhoE
LAQRHPGQRVLIVAHGAIISSVLDRWGTEGKGDWARLDPHNCAVSELTWDGQSWRVELLNDISHLPPEATAAVLPSYDPEAETARL